MLGGHVGDVGGEVIFLEDGKGSRERLRARLTAVVEQRVTWETVPLVIQALVISLLDYVGLTLSNLFFSHFIRKAIVFSPTKFFFSATQSF